MAHTPEYMTPDDSLLVPSDQETIKSSRAFGLQLQEYADALDTFFHPDAISEHHTLPFSALGDGSLTVIATHSGTHSTLDLGYHAPDDSQDGFRASKTSDSNIWLGNGTQRHPDWRVAKMLDANWPGFYIDNSAIRSLTEKEEEGVTYQDIIDIMEPIAKAYGKLVTSTHTFEHEWSWGNGSFAPLVCKAAVTIERVRDEKPSYKLIVSLPHDHRPGARANVTCIAHFDEHFGVSYKIEVDDPTLTKLDINLSAIAAILEDVLGTIIAKREDDVCDNLDIDALRLALDE